MGTLAPQKGVVSDTFLPLMEIWKTLKEDPALVKSWYRERWSLLEKDTKQQVYEQVKASYNQRPNGADFLFLSRACYGGVVRFRKADGYMSTPCGVHTPIPPKSFEARVDLWSERIAGTTFHHMDYTEAMDQAVSGDLIYCDPPYSYSQAILYGAQGFSLQKLFSKIRSCKERGVYVALSLDGSKKSGNLVCRVDIPEGLFEREVSVNCGRSMLKRFQMEGKSLENELVSDRLLLTY
jgi:DNA adenine methylase